MLLQDDETGKQPPISSRSLSPVPIHSLFRAGSTWLFNRFRRGTSDYWYYQEPFHKRLNDLREKQDRLLEISDDLSLPMRHSNAQKPDSLRHSNEAVSELRERIATAHGWEQKLEVQMLRKVKKADSWHRLYVQITNSSSWRLTKVMRVFTRLLKGDPIAYKQLNAILRVRFHRFQERRIASPFGAKSLRQKIYSRLARQSTFKPEIRRLERKVRGGPFHGKKVAVLIPLSATGVIGGAERFYSGLGKALSEEGCVVDMVCISVDEANFTKIKEAYSAFERLDLGLFDLVISTKAPTFAARHPNHLLYLLHTVRVFYDMWEDRQENVEIQAQRDWIHSADNAALAAIKHRFSIGTEVSRRLLKWNGYDAEIIHPPLELEGLYDRGSGGYIFMPGRLHSWKRVDLAIRAIKLSSLPIHLIISGVGETESELREIARGDSRIKFVGQVEDDDLKRLYAEALAVSFLPLREDYGYVTLEAFASGKPVITCIDSGGPTDFVEHNISGFVCSPDPISVRDAFEMLWCDPNLAKVMGNAGRERTAKLNWKSVVDQLLRTGFPEIATPKYMPRAPLRVAILDMQPIIPAIGGGRLRLLGLYHGLGPDIEARYVGTYDWPGERFRRHRITPTLEEIDVPLSSKHHEAAAIAAKQADGKAVIDAMFPEQAHLSEDYLKETLRAVEWAEVVIFSHPWVSPLVPDQALIGKTIIYDAHNVEAVLRPQLFDRSSQFQATLLDEVKKLECSTGDRADLILACSEDDASEFVRLYGWNRSQIRVVPNGVFSNVVCPPDKKQKQVARRLLKIKSEAFVGFFIGSDYGPNITAAKFIAKQLAPQLPDIIFVIAGGAGAKLPATLPPNVRATGFLEDAEKARWLWASDFAINPMLSGSGTNIKMFDFMSSGLPVVSTPIGARGIASVSQNGILIADCNELVDQIRQLSSDRVSAHKRGQQNRRIVKENYSWETLSPVLGRIIRSTHLRKLGINVLTTSKARIAHLSTVGIKCGIGEYTRKLIRTYNNNNIENYLLTARAANEEPDLSDLTVDNEICWYFDNVQWKYSLVDADLTQRISHWGATHLIVQYHPGFFSPAVLKGIVADATNHGIRCAVVVHNFLPNLADTICYLKNLGTMVFSHRMSEICEAYALGAVLDQIPMPIEDAGTVKVKTIGSRNWHSEPPVIVVNGFMRAHKGIRSLVRAMPTVISKFPGAKLVIQCALNNSEDAHQEFEELTADIAFLKLSASVVVDTRFLQKDQILATLKQTDIAVLPYDASNEGSSATAADCIAAGLPLIISDAEIFDEIRELAFTTQRSAEEIAQSILAVLSDPDLYASLSSKSFSHAMTNSWASIAGALLSCLDSTSIKAVNTYEMN